MTMRANFHHPHHDYCGACSRRMVECHAPDVVLTLSSYICYGVLGRDTVDEDPSTNSLPVLRLLISLRAWK